MNTVDAVASIGEVLSWIGLGLGLPLLLLAFLGRLHDGAWTPTDIVVVAPERTVARWFSAAGLHERALTPGERDRIGDAETFRAFVSSRDPATMRLDPFRQATRTMLVLGVTLATAGAVCTAVSLLPLVMP